MEYCAYWTAEEQQEGAPTKATRVWTNVVWEPRGATGNGRCGRRRGGCRHRKTAAGEWEGLARRPSLQRNALLRKPAQHSGSRRIPARADGDGVADVDEMEPADLAKHKLQIAMTAVKEPERLQQACGALFPWSPPPLRLGPHPRRGPWHRCGR